jgi:hypothetical protein
MTPPPVIHRMVTAGIIRRRLSGGEVQCSGVTQPTIASEAALLVAYASAMKMAMKVIPSAR